MSFSWKGVFGSSQPETSGQRPSRDPLRLSVFSRTASPSPVRQDPRNADAVGGKANAKLDAADAQPVQRHEPLSPQHGAERLPLSNDSSARATDPLAPPHVGSKPIKVVGGSTQDAHGSAMNCSAAASNTGSNQFSYTSMMSAPSGWTLEEWSIWSTDDGRSIYETGDPIALAGIQNVSRCCMLVD